MIAVLEAPMTMGGGFNQALNAILQMKRICEGIFEFEVFTTNIENIKYLEDLGVKAVFIKYSIIDKLISWRLSNRLCDLIIRRFQIIGRFEAKILRRGGDLVYFLNQSDSSVKLQKLNYINTVFDLCNRDRLEFPEVRYINDFHAMERHFKNNLAPSLIILTASDKLSDLISSRYGIDGDRLLAMPFAPTPFLGVDCSVDKRLVLNIYGLEEGYYFYPAQFWAHKNHVRILEALLLLREKGNAFKVVFAGGDKGNRAYVERLVTQHSLEEQVRFLGFVPVEHMRGLYEGCAAVIMPTYFGPTNLPPLEAWMTGKPLIYSSQLIDEVGEAAICANPDDPDELAAAMIACNDFSIRAKLVEAGYLRLREIEQQRTEAELKLRNALLLFSVRRKCWA